MSRPVGRLSRAFDLLSILLILGGSTLFMSSYLGMQRLRDSVPTEFIAGQTAYFERLNEHERLRRSSNIGLAVAGIGLMVGVSAAVHARRLSRRSNPTPQT